MSSHDEHRPLPSCNGTCRAMNNLFFTAVLQHTLTLQLVPTQLAMAV